MAGLYASALLDELMGRNRDADPNDKKRRDLHWSDPEVCIIISSADRFCARFGDDPFFCRSVMSAPVSTTVFSSLVTRR